MDNLLSLQMPGRIWEYVLSKEKYLDDGSVAKAPEALVSKLPMPEK